MSASHRTHRSSATSSLSLIAVVLAFVASWIAVTPRRRTGTPMAGNDGLVLI